MVDEREVIALFAGNSKLSDELKTDISKIAPKPIFNVSVKDLGSRFILSGFILSFDDGSGRPAHISVALNKVEILEKSGRLRSNKVRIKFGVGAIQRPGGIDQGFEEEFTELFWRRNGMKVIKSKILDLVNVAIKK